MHHLYPSLKGDQLCPLGFHPQTRYPTRCKRCFRDYKEHGGRRGSGDATASSPNLTDNLNSRPNSRTWTSTQNLSATNGNSNNEIVVNFNVELKKRPQSWTSTPDVSAHSSKSNQIVQRQLSEENHVNVTLNLPEVTQRPHSTPSPKQVYNSNDNTAFFTENISKTANLSETPASSSSLPSTSKKIPEDLIIRATDSLAERARKMNLLKKQRSLNSKDSNKERTLTKTIKRDAVSLENSIPSDKPHRPERTKSSSTSAGQTNDDIKQLPSKTNVNETNKSISSVISETEKSVNESKSSNATSPSPSPLAYLKSTKSKVSPASTPSTPIPTTQDQRKESDRWKSSQDVQFLLNIKDNKYSNKKHGGIETMSLTTEAPDKIVVANSEEDYKEQIKHLQADLDAMKARAEKVEREKSDLLLRRLASIDIGSNRTAASEALTLQKKVNELREQLDKVTEEKRRLNVRMKDLESNPKGEERELRRKLQAAEQICEELMEENQLTKKEIMNLQAEMDELQDTFREDEIKAKTTLQKDLEKTTKNCRVLSFKLKKCERKIEILEQDRQNSGNEQLNARIKQLEEELRFSNDLTRKLQIEAEELRNPGKKKAPTLGILGKSSSVDTQVTRESLTRGGSQEDPQQLLRDLQDSVERESDLKEQLKFAEEEAENLRKKVTRMEDENDSLMMQLKKMATRSKTYGMTNRMVSEAQSDRDEGISDEDDPAELRILLDLNEQEASILRQKVEDLEKQNSDAKKQLRELQDKIRKMTKDTPSSGLLAKRQLSSIEEDTAALRSRITALETEKERLQKENQRLQPQTLRRNSNPLVDKSGSTGNDLVKLKESVSQLEEERNSLQTKLKIILQECDERLPPRKAMHITDLTPRNQLKKYVEQLDQEICEMRAIVLKCGASNIQSLEADKKLLEEELDKSKKKLTQMELDLQKLKESNVTTTKGSDLEKQLKKSEENTKHLNTKIKDLEDKVKKQDSLIKNNESSKALLEQQYKADKEKLSKLEKDFEKERKEREKLESKLNQKETDLQTARKNSDKIKQTLEKEMKEIKVKASSKLDSKQVQELKKQIQDLETSLEIEAKRYKDLNMQWERYSEEAILMRAQLTTEKSNLQSELSTAQQKINEMETMRTNRLELTKKLNDAQKKIEDLEMKTLKSGAQDIEKSLLQHKLTEKNQEYDRLRRENEMNIDLIFQLRRDNDELNNKLNDFSRVEQVKSSMNDRSAALEKDVKALKSKLENTELQMKSEVASTRLRYEQQVKNLSVELTSMQRQCERFKKDRDTFKQMLELAQKKIGELKANNSGRVSRTSMHSSDDDDKSKITYLEQQIGCLEDQLVEARLEVSKVKTELVSERSANEIKISEMQSKLNEFEEEKVLGSGRTKIPGMKTRLELSWQKEREEQQRLLQETSTLARDLRQTLFEVERERDKERLEAKRRLEQLKNTNDEEMEEGRRKISELQCDLLELRDVHAKLRTSNEKLRRERERYEKEFLKYRIEQQSEDRRIGTLLQTVDQLVKIAPVLTNTETQQLGKASATSNVNFGSMLTRLAEASEEIHKYQRLTEEEYERNRLRRSHLRRAVSQENDTQGSQSSIASAGSVQRNGVKLSRSHRNGSSLRKKSLSLDHSMQKDQNIWRQEGGSVSSIQSIDSDMDGFKRGSSIDSHLDSRLSGGSTQSDIPRLPRKKKKSLMGKLKSFTKSGRNSESEISIQGSDSDISIASDVRVNKKDLRNRLSDMFKRSGSTSRGGSAERISSEFRPVAVTVMGGDDENLPASSLSNNPVTTKPPRTISKPPTPTTPLTKRKIIK